MTRFVALANPVASDNRRISRYVILGFSDGLRGAPPSGAFEKLVYAVESLRTNYLMRATLSSPFCIRSRIAFFGEAKSGGNWCTHKVSFNMAPAAACVTVGVLQLTLMRFRRKYTFYMPSIASP